MTDSCDWPDSPDQQVPNLGGIRARGEQRQKILSLCFDCSSGVMLRPVANRENRTDGPPYLMLVINVVDLSRNPGCGLHSDSWSHCHHEQHCSDQDAAYPSAERMLPIRIKPWVQSH